MTIWCEPEFFVKWVMSLGIAAKNLGWQIVLISFVMPHTCRLNVLHCPHQGRKVKEKNII